MANKLDEERAPNSRINDIIMNMQKEQRDTGKIVNDIFTKTTEEQKNLHEKNTDTITNKPNVIIGIDFGTTKTCAAVFRNNQFEIIPDRNGRLTMPSLVLIGPEKEIFIGWGAKLHSKRYDSEYITINSIKQILGKSKDYNLGNWKACPQEVAALILARLKMEVEEYLGQNITDAVIAVPAHFDTTQRWSVKQAAEIAGFHVKRLINDTSAAVSFYSRFIDNSLEKNAIAIDIGGGTTDVSVITYGEGVIEVKSTVGENTLGGNEVDKIILDHIKTIIRNQFEGSIFLTTLQELILSEAAANSKIELSNALTTHIFIPAFIKRSEKTYDNLDITLTVNQFDHLIEPLGNKILFLIDKALNISEIQFSQINSLILLGGSSRIPKLREMISQYLGINPLSNVDPDHIVAKGVATLAGVYQGNIKDVLLLDTNPYSISVESSDGWAERMILKDTTIPTRTSKLLYTTRDFQKEIEFRIYEGESELINKNTYLGSLVLKIIPLTEKGSRKIAFTLDLLVDGTIQVSAEVVGTNNKISAMICAPSRLSQEQINKMQKTVFEATAH